uniref:Hopanoid-associated phosphorylase n=1 Tax=Candidatus Kentrum sp. TC TaxID=2126339 RepID=A0A451A570_9GAMM|nr:MAG: hopanoid-associated phosphorylase [Candidatus Kentron sp. TC]
MRFIEDSPGTGLSAAKPGIIAALPLEAACFAKVDIGPRSHRVIEGSLLYYGGVGAENAARAARALMDLKVDALVSWGTAGALDPRLGPGDIVLPTEVIDHADGKRYSVNPYWHGVLGNKLHHKRIYSQGAIVSTRSVQSAPRQKAGLHRTTGAMAADMESAAIAAVAGTEEKPFIVIRSISDTAAMHIPQSAIHATDRYGKVSIPGLFAHLMKNPAELRHYPKLIRSLAKTKRSLREITELCGFDLCLGEAL